MKEFPSPYGVSFILILLFYFNCFILSMSFRLLTEYHSFLLKTVSIHSFKREVSVSLWSIIHSYADDRTSVIKFDINAFPSPYGVSFILIDKITCMNIILEAKGFPSPYGVSFILIQLRRHLR